MHVLFYFCLVLKVRDENAKPHKTNQKIYIVHEVLRNVSKIMFNIYTINAIKLKML